ITALGINSAAITGTSSHLYVNGEIFASNGNGMALKDYANSIDVGSTGSIQALLTAVYIDGYSAYIVNRGEISGNLGIYITGGYNTIINTGTIAAFGNDAIHVGGTAGAGTPNDLTNYGTITGSVAYYGGDVSDSIVNLGTMSGAVYLQGGGDMF